MKKIFVIVAVILCCSVSYAQKRKHVEENNIERTYSVDTLNVGSGEFSNRINVVKSGGRIIREGNNEGKIGYNAVKQKIALKENGSYEIIVAAAGKGVNICPEVYKVGNCSNTGTLTAEVYNFIVTKLHEQIDMGEKGGGFCNDGFYCSWRKGEKIINEKGVKYAYILIMRDEASIIIDDKRVK